MSAPMADLEAVLAAHDWYTPRGYAWPTCVCGMEFQTGDEQEAFAHQATAVRAWLAEVLLSEATVEAVRQAIATRRDGHAATAALQAAVEVLGVRP